MFLEINDSGEIGSEMMWDALKAVVRGKLCLFVHVKRKKDN